MELAMSFVGLREAAAVGGAVVNEAKTMLLSATATEAVSVTGRLGRWTDQGFSADVGSKSFYVILQLLESYERWSKVVAWEESQEIYFSSTLPSEGGEESSTKKTQVRTIVSSSPEGQHSVAHVVKCHAKSADFSLQTIDHGSCTVDSDGVGDFLDDLSARLTASLEQSLPAALLPVVVTPDLVKIKEKKSFVLPSSGVGRDTFAFNATIVYSGESKSETERSQRKNEKVSYEIEVVCLAPLAYMAVCADHEGVCLALSLLLKLLDFASRLNHDTHVTFVPR